MVRYLDYNEFLNLIKNCELTINFRDVNNDELDGLFETFEKKQTGLKIPNGYRGEIITTIDFGELRKGDIILIIKDKKHYLSIVEEVLYNEI